MKIAIISPTTHDNIGGAEKYARLLIGNFIGNGHEVTEFPIMQKNNSKPTTARNPKVIIDRRLLGLIPYTMVWAGTYSRRNMRYIFNEFDVVIWNTGFPARKYISHKKSIVIQHQRFSWYSFKGKPFWEGIGGFFGYWLFGVGGTIVSPFRKANHSVFFTKKPPYKISGTWDFMPLPAENNIVKNKNRSGSFWIGRVNNKQKNIDAVVNIANKLHSDLYGDGVDKKLLYRLTDYSSYKGRIGSDQVKTMMNKYKVMFLPSNWEGFPFVVVEALHSGVPVVSYNSSDSMNFFTKSNAFFLVKNQDEMIQKTLEIIQMSPEKYNILMNNAINFARKNLSVDSFNQKWENIIENITKKANIKT